MHGANDEAVALHLAQRLGEHLLADAHREFGDACKSQLIVLDNVTSGLAFVPLAITPIYSAIKAGLHSYTESLRAQLQGTSVRVIALPPPAVATDLMLSHEVSPMSMPLQAYIDESMALLAANPNAPDCVQNAMMLCDAKATGQYAAVFSMLHSPR